MILLYVILTVYILAVNVYSLLLLKWQKDAAENGGDEPKDGKLLLAALLGGAITIYACMFIMRYRLGSLLLMVLLPVLSVLNVYVFFLAYKSGFGLVVV